MAATPPPRSASPGIARAVALIQRGAPGHALTLLERAHSATPQDVDVRYWMANACRAAGHATRANELFERLAHERPSDLDIAFGYAFALRDQGRHVDAASVLERALARAPAAPLRVLQASRFLRDGGDAEAALRCLTHYRGPADTGLLTWRARLRQSVGEFDGARTDLLRAIDENPDAATAWTLLAQQHTFRAGDEILQRLIRTAKSKLVGDAGMTVAFAMGKACDDLGEFSDAWHWYRQANAAAASRHRFDGELWCRKSTGGLNQRQSEDPSGGRAIFIVGMPRSGTTLLERLLSRHPRVHGRGELNTLKSVALRGVSDSAATFLWSGMQRQGPETDYFIDKNPLNFRYLDTLFALLPSAHVLHITRDPRDTALSCYRQLFAHDDMAFSYRLRDLLTAADHYAAMMRAAARRDYAARIHHVRYEDLVTETADVMARIADHVGLPHAAFEPGAAPDGAVRSASVWQARQAPHRGSIGNWQRYEHFAPDFFAELGRAARAPGRSAPGT